GFGPGDVRMLAELQRDGAGRARQLRGASAGSSPGPGTLADGLGDAVLARLAPARGALHVVEWLERGRSLIGLVTRIDASGTASSRWLHAPDLSVGSLAVKLRARL